MTHLDNHAGWSHANGTTVSLSLSRFLSFFPHVLFSDSPTHAHTCRYTHIQSTHRVTMVKALSAPTVKTHLVNKQLYPLK